MSENTVSTISDSSREAIVSLWSAARHFASDAIVSEARRRRANGLEEAKKQIDEMPAGNLRTFCEAMFKNSNMYSVDDLDHVFLQNILLTKIFRKELVAYGYALPRKADDPTVPIPLDVIQAGKVRWDKNTIEGNGMQFVGVVVGQASSEICISHSSTSSSKENTPRKVGRPGLLQLIQETTQLAIDAGEINIHGKLSEGFPAVLKRLKAHPQIGNLPANSTLFRHMKPVFERQRKLQVK